MRRGGFVAATHVKMVWGGEAIPDSVAGDRRCIALIHGTKDLYKRRATRYNWRSATVKGMSEPRAIPLPPHPLRLDRLIAGGAACAR